MENSGQLTIRRDESFHSVFVGSLFLIKISAGLPKINGFWNVGSSMSAFCSLSNLPLE
jgi:hypothetical protein